MKQNRIVMFGAGAIGKLLTEKKRSTTEIVAYIVDGLRGDIGGVPIISLDDINSIVYDYVVVAFGDSVKGIRLLEEAGVPAEKIVGFSYSGITYSDSVLQTACDKNAKVKLKNERINDLFDIEEKKYYLCGMNVPINSEIIERDYVREQTLVFLAEEVYRKELKGSVCEIGVAGGHFAQKINKVFPDRTLYLFDTYAGLADRDRDYALEMGWGEAQYARDNRGILPKDVLARMPYQEKCVIKKGYFPDTFDIDEPISFVSIDIDFYESIRSGLEVIYPKMESGGYIMVHDYHNLTFAGSRQAIIDFCDENNVPYVPIPDNGGTAIIAVS